MTVEVPADLVVRETDRSARELAKKIRLPGFRPGKVPVEMRGGSSQTNINFTIVAADTRDMDRLLMDRRSLIVGMVSDGMRSPSSLRDSMRRSL